MIKDNDNDDIIIIHDEGWNEKKMIKIEDNGKE